MYIEETKLGAASISRKYCGHYIPPNYNSLSNRIKVVFESDPLSHVDYGFKATWMEVGSKNGGKFVRNLSLKSTSFEGSLLIVSSPEAMNAALLSAQ